MTRLTRSVFLFLFFFCIGSTMALAQESVYEGDIPCSTDTDVSLVKVLINKSDTVFTLRFTNSDLVTLKVYLSPVGSPGAFVLTDLKSGKDYELKANGGLPLFPDELAVESGNSVEFTLTFDAIDPNSRFELVEGSMSNEMTNITLWRFSDIDLNTMSKLK